MKALCHKATAWGHTKYNKQQKAYNKIGSKINMFLESLGVVTDTIEVITIQATGVEDNKEYQVCATLKTQIEAAVAS